MYTPKQHEADGAKMKAKSVPIYPRFKMDEKRHIADGIPFNDIEGLPPKTISILAARGLIWLTQFNVRDRNNTVRSYQGTIIARDYEDAEVIAFGRGLEEEVVGIFRLKKSIEGRV